MEIPYPCLKLDKVICRRKSDPQIVLRVWNAISCASRDGRPSSMEVLLEYANADAEKIHLPDVGFSYFRTQLNCAVEDDLLVEERGLYFIPSAKNARLDGHDWYCFQCHTPGNVVLCKSCWRVYHPMCILKQQKSANLFSCLICQSLQENQKPVSSQLLAFVLIRLRNKTSPLYNLQSCLNSVPEALSMIFCEMMDLDTVQSKVIDNSYSSAVQFEHDIFTLYHNVAVAYGVSSEYAELAKILLKDCRYELEELLLCSDCYFFSNFKPKDWFCYPCSIPHQLVYAKLKGFPYWPAKIIKATPKGYNVRFFGALHQRALIPEAFIRSIETNRAILFPRKPNSSLVKSLEELDLHLKMIEEKSTFSMDVEIAQIFENKKSSKRKLAVSSSEVSAVRDEKSDLSSLYLSESESEGMHSSSMGDLIYKMSPSKRQRIENQTSSDHNNSVNGHGSAEESLSGAASATDQGQGQGRDTVQLRMLSEYAKYIRQNPNHSKWTVDELRTTWCKKFMLKKSDVFLKTILDIETMLRQRETEQTTETVQAMEKRFEGELSKTKKRQWCYNCERPAQYYCCWNTSYCSHPCQREHWQKEHRNTCRRVHRNQGNNPLSNGRLALPAPPEKQLSSSSNGS